MDKIIKKLNKLSLSTVILIASLVVGGFYYASEVNKQKSIERQQEIKIQEEQTKIDLAKQEQEQAKQALNTCIATAETNYSNWWYQECKTRGLLTNRCISLHDMTAEEYKKQNPDKLYPALDFYDEKNECGNCSLPLANGDRINKSRQDAKDECFKKYPQK